MTATNGNGKSVILNLAEPGTILGSNAWVTARPYEATFRNSASGSTGHSSVVKFLALLNHHPDISLRASQHLARDCQSAYQVIRSFGLSYSALERLVQLLLEWSTGAAVVNGSIRPKLSWTHEELGSVDRYFERNDHANP